MFKCRCLIHQNHFPDIRHVHTNSNPIARYRYLNQKPVFLQRTIHSLNSHVRLATNSAVEMTTDKGSVRFCIDKQVNRLQEREKKQRRIQVSKKAKLNELRFYRLKAKKKMRSPNPEVRILYRLGKVRLVYSLLSALFTCQLIYVQCTLLSFNPFDPCPFYLFNKTQLKLTRSLSS
ncbi:putative CRM domain-containing protein [Helianthus annuus]|nr:putative CRM domain-containing protein [Helianthus annuus]